MPSFTANVIRQPQPQDIVDDPVEVCGIGTAFEGVLAVRVRDGNGSELIRQTIHAGGTGVWGNFHATLPLGGVPATPNGSVETFESSAKDGSEINKTIVPVVFGTALVPDYHGFAQYTVKPGDTLSGIAKEFYAGDASKYTIIFEANRDQITNPNLIYPGQTLRIPQ